MRGISSSRYAIQLVTVALMLFIQPASASLISVNDTVFGIDSVTRDTATGLEWLDVTKSVSRSFSDLTGVDGTNEFLPGGDFEGWGYATADDVDRLFVDAGVRTAAFSVTGFEINFVTSASRVDAFLDFTGRTGGGSLFGGITFSEVRGTFAPAAGAGLTGEAFVRLARSRSSLDIRSSSIEPRLRSPSRVFRGSGAWLMRVSLPVPEPPTILLLGLALAGVGFKRRK